MFVRFECDCIGIVAAGLDDASNVVAVEAVIVSACDEDRDAPRDSLTWFSRDMTGKTFAPLSAERVAALHAQLGRRLAYADRYSAICVALGLSSDGGTL